MSSSDRHALPPRAPSDRSVSVPGWRGPESNDARRWSSADLFGASSEIQIEHGTAVYRLRRTSLGKLILTK